MVPSLIGMSYSLPVRLSRTVRELLLSDTGAPSLSSHWRHPRVLGDADPSTTYSPSLRPRQPVSRFDPPCGQPVAFVVATPAALGPPHEDSGQTRVKRNRAVFVRGRSTTAVPGLP